MTYEQWLEQYKTLEARAKAYEHSVDLRLRRMAKQAGIDSGDYMYIHLHNAWVGRKGKFWANVDYTVLYQMVQLEARMWNARHIVNEWSTRSYRNVTR